MTDSNEHSWVATQTAVESLAAELGASAARGGRHRVHPREDLLPEALFDPDRDRAHGRVRRLPRAARSRAVVARLFAADCTWVVHSARQDLEVVWQRAQRLPVRLIDTQVAAALAGFPPQIGLEGLLERTLDVELGESYARTDWSRRPLPAGRSSTRSMTSGSCCRPGGTSRRSSRRSAGPIGSSRTAGESSPSRRSPIRPRFGPA